MEIQGDLFDAIFTDRQGNQLKEMLVGWCREPITTNPFFTCKQDPRRGFFASSTKYDLAQVLSTSYVSDNFLDDYQALIPNFFFG
jgi:hypothetical protein